jgi:hypothetical protein
LRPFTVRGRRDVLTDVRAQAFFHIISPLI